MADKNLYRIIAALVAIFIYLFIALSLVTYLKDDSKLKKDYGYNVEDAIVVNIDSLLDEKPKPLEKLIPKPVQKPISKPIEPVHKVEPIILPPDPEPEPKPKVEPIILPPDPEPKEEEDARDKEAKSAKDLFSTLRTDDYKKVMRERQKQEEARASRLAKQEAKKIKKEAEEKKQKEQKKRAEAKKAREAVEQMQISTASQSKKSGEKHEFWSFVSDKIMAKWQRTISTQDGLSATVVIRIDKRGKLSYSDLESSNNSMFDTKLKVFLDNLEYDRFPSYKEGSFIEAQFEFTDKEKGL